MKPSIRRHPLLIYFLLSFSIAWAVALLIFAWRDFQTFRGEEVVSEGASTQGFLWVWLAMLAAPTVAALLVSWWEGGKEQVNRLLGSITRWRVAWRWYAAALLLIPAILMLVTYGLLPLNSAYQPGLLLGFGIGGGFIGGFFEEVGWTGYATPRLHARFHLFRAGLLLGAIHAVWHWLPDYMGTISFYQRWYPLHLLLWLIALIAFRLITMWIFVHSRSTLLGQLTHGSFTGGQIVFGAPAASAEETLLWYGLFAAGLVIAAAVIVAKDRQTFFGKGSGTRGVSWEQG